MYGPLKRDQRNHHILDNNDAEFICQTTTADSSFLMQCFESVTSPGKYTPGVFAKGDSKISGELYHVAQNIMDDLDKLEGLGRKYKRQYISLDNGQQAWIYIEIEGKRKALEKTPHIAFKNNIYNWN